MAAPSGAVQYSFAALLSYTSALVQLTHNLNRNFVRADDARNGSEETATAFTVSKTSHNSRTKL